jgi:hypothetical protein
MMGQSIVFNSRVMTTTHSDFPREYKHYYTLAERSTIHALLFLNNAEMRNTTWCKIYLQPNPASSVLQESSSI